MKFINIFSKPKTIEAASVATLEVKEEVKASKYPAVVEEIHRSFYTASERILKEAQDIINGVDQSSIEKANRLSKLGFSSAKGVKDAEKQDEEAKKMKDIQTTLVEYKMKYPLYKFITEAEIMKVCEKYNLVFAKSSQYKGFVPKKNLRDIENFKGVAPEDDMVLCRSSYVPSSNDDFDLKYFSQTRTSALELIDRAKEHNNSIMEKLKTETNPEERKYLRDSFSHYYISEIPLFICAPQSDIDMTNAKIVDRKVVQNIPDPIVVKKVRGDLYVIITAWGDEASDPLVVNETSN